MDIDHGIEQDIDPNADRNPQTVAHENWRKGLTGQEQQTFKDRKAAIQKKHYHSQDPQIRSEKRKQRYQKGKQLKQEQRQGATSTSASNINLYTSLSPDLARGSESDPDAPIITWSNGSTTILPYIPKVVGIEKPLEERTRRTSQSRRHCTLIPVEPAETKTVNAILEDANATSYLATCPFATEDNPGPIKFIRRSNFSTRQEFLLAIQTETRWGHVVVCKDHYPQFRCDFNLEAIEESLGMDREQIVEAIDAERREVNNTSDAPIKGFEYQTMSLQSFYDHTFDFTKVQAILDLPLAHRSMPEDIDSLDEGLLIGWNRTLVTHQSAAENFSISPFMGRTWGLLHHGGFITYPHHDGDGLNTYIIPRSGAKLWAIIDVECSDSLKDFNQVLSLLDDDILLRTKGRPPHANIYILQAEPGDLVIQPPGTLHTVYTPQRSIATGGSYLSYDTMHLTEFSMRVDASHGLLVSIQDGGASIFTLLRMVLALPQLTTRVFYERALVALCIMVLIPQDYMPEQADKARQASPESASELFLPAQAIAKQVLNGVLLCDIEAAKDILYDTDYKNPGEDLCLPVNFYKEHLP